MKLEGPERCTCVPNGTKSVTAFDRSNSQSGGWVDSILPRLSDDEVDNRVPLWHTVSMWGRRGLVLLAVGVTLLFSWGNAQAAPPCNTYSCQLLRINFKAGQAKPPGYWAQWFCQTFRFGC